MLDLLFVDNLVTLLQGFMDDSLVFVGGVLREGVFYSKFISCLYVFQAPCARHQEVKIVLYSIWYHHTL